VAHGLDSPAVMYVELLYSVSYSDQLRSISLKVLMYYIFDTFIHMIF